MAFSTSWFHHQVSRHQWWGRFVPHTSSVVLSSPVLMLFQISSVAPSATPADMLTCKLKTSWKWLLVWGSLSFETLRRGVNLRLDFDGTSILMSHTKSWYCRATSSPGITFTSVTSLRIVLRKRTKSICVATFPNLYVMRWLSGFLKHVFPISRLNAKAYSRILSPSTSGSCHTPSHHALPCIQCLHGLHGCSSLHMGSEILMLGSWQSQHAADQRTGPYPHHLDHSVGHTQTER